MPDEKTTYHRLISLFVKQSYEYMICQAQKLSSGSFNTRINYILDEFLTLPTIKDFSAMITAARSRNIRFNLCIQSQQQLVYRYREEAETIKSNCNNWIFLTSRELKLLQEISSLAGTDSRGKAIISVSALQHLDKERGQVFVFCGRLFPYVAELVDIDAFDQGKYDVLRLVERKQAKELHSKSINESRYSSSERITTQTDSKLEIDELSKMLEKKFDELFGSLDEDSCEHSFQEEVSIQLTTDDCTLESEKSADSEIDNIIILNDENGNEVSFEFLDLVEYDNTEYVILLPVAEDESIEQGVVILQLEESTNDCEESYVSVDDERILQAVFQIFKDKFKDEFDFTDSPDNSK